MGREHPEDDFGARSLRGEHLRLHLLGEFQLEHDGPTVAVPEGSQRLLAYLALRGRCVGRAAAAGTLWPAATKDHAASSLRSALARLPGPARAALVASARDLRLAEGVRVDWGEARVVAHRLLDSPAEALVGHVTPQAISTLSRELLPDWYDEWVQIEAEDWRQLRLHALEGCAHWLIDQRRYGDATQAALAAVRVDALREGPRAALIRIHIAEGNLSEAIREYTRYRELLLVELGLEPTSRLRALLTRALTAVRREDAVWSRAGSSVG